jgi:hypothetical protein
MPASRFAKWACTPESGVTEVTGVTNTSHSSISAALEVGPEVTRVVNRKVTKVTASSPSAVPLSLVTRHPEPELPRKSFRNQGSNPGNPSNLENEESPISANAAADAAWWHDLFEKRVAIRGIYCGRTRESAEGLAFGDVILEWHLRYGAGPDPHRCTGCGDELAARTGLLLCDGARVHFDGVRGANCVTAYGQKWRGAAVVALGTLGIEAPRGFR